MYVNFTIRIQEDISYFGVLIVRRWRYQLSYILHSCQRRIMHCHPYFKYVLAVLRVTLLKRFTNHICGNNFFVNVHCSLNQFSRHSRLNIHSFAN